MLSRRAIRGWPRRTARPPRPPRLWPAAVGVGLDAVGHEQPLDRRVVQPLFAVPVSSPWVTAAYTDTAPRSISTRAASTRVPARDREIVDDQCGSALDRTH